MDENLITKRELLELTGISYGALYRWKRMKLLPDEWFIHRSTVTGHETFLPREKALQRVAEIQSLKETMTLDEIARRFQPGPPGEITMTPGEAAGAGIALPPIINQYLALSQKEGPLEYGSLLELYIFSHLLTAGNLSRDEAYEIARAAGETDDISQPVVYLIRKYGVPFCITAGEMQTFKFDSGATLAATVSVTQEKTALDTLLQEKGMLL